MDAAAQNIRLEAGLAAQRDESGFDRSARGPELLDNADLIIGDVANDIRHADENNEDDGSDGPETDADDMVAKIFHDCCLQSARADGRNREYLNFEYDTNALQRMQQCWRRMNRTKSGNFKGELRQFVPESHRAALPAAKIAAVASPDSSMPFSL
jgi:hypothetical protein